VKPKSITFNVFWTEWGFAWDRNPPHLLFIELGPFMLTVEWE
jgi:hypothetical protein